MKSEFNSHSKTGESAWHKQYVWNCLIIIGSGWKSRAVSVKIMNNLLKFRNSSFEHSLNSKVEGFSDVWFKISPICLLNCQNNFRYLRP